MRRCGSCDFFKRDGEGAGECRRQPPNTLQIAESGSGIVGAERGPAIRLRSYWPPGRAHRMKTYIAGAGSLNELDLPANVRAQLRVEAARLVAQVQELDMLETGDLDALSGCEGRP